MKNTDIIDKYSNITFGVFHSVNQLRNGMMIQIVESNKMPLSWEWVEVDDNLITKLLELNKDKYEFIRIPNYYIEPCYHMPFEWIHKEHDTDRLYCSNCGELTIDK